MRERFGELQLPVVLGHGDLKPSNVMAGADAPPPGADEAVSFIDFELAGACPPRAILRKSAQFCAILRNSAQFSDAACRSPRRWSACSTSRSSSSAT